MKFLLIILIHKQIMSKFAPAGIKSSVNGGAFGAMSLKKKKLSKSKMSLVDPDNVRNMKSQ